MPKLLLGTNEFMKIWGSYAGCTAVRDNPYPIILQQQGRYAVLGYIRASWVKHCKKPLTSRASSLIGSRCSIILMILSVNYFGLKLTPMRQYCFSGKSHYRGFIPITQTSIELIKSLLLHPWWKRPSSRNGKEYVCLFVCFITKSFLTYSFVLPTPTLSTVCRPLSSYVCSITSQPTSAVAIATCEVQVSAADSHTVPTVATGVSKPLCCRLTLTFTLTSENLSLYITLLLLLVVIQLCSPRCWHLDSNYCRTRCRQSQLRFVLPPLLLHLRLLIIPVGYSTFHIDLAS